MEVKYRDISRPTNFDSIELEKENIIPLKDGRSAQKLAEVLHQDSFELNQTRVEFEKRLLNDLEDLDDPLELFLEYITWINDVAPQGATSKRSGMLDVIERCLMYFRDIETYKNDPRLLKLWLWYIELFSPSSSRETHDIFIYMLRKGIGRKLALYYEEFSSLLFEMRRYKEAIHIIRIGSNENARPHSRLLRRLNEYEARLRELNIEVDENVGSDQPILESELPAFVLGRERSSITSNTLATAAVSRSGVQADVSNNESSKYKIFNDTSASNHESSKLKKDGWDILDHQFNRGKENRVTTSKLAAGFNLGKLAQEEESNTLRTGRLAEKIPIFKDSLGRSEPVYKILEVPGKKPEKIDCNFKLLYPNHTEEFCIEEILAISRSLYYKRNTRLRSEDDENDQRSVGNADCAQERKRKKVPLAQKSTHRSTQLHFPNSPSDDQRPKISSKTSILPLNDITDDENTDSCQNGKILNPPNSPTITYFSKNAMHEVYSMFNQNYNEPKPTFENDDTKSKFAFFENFTEEFTRANMDDLTEVKSQVTEEQNQNDNIISSNSDPPPLYDQDKRYASLSTGRTRLPAFMSAIQEKNENDSNDPGRRTQESSNLKSDNDTAPSSPFVTQPQLHDAQKNIKDSAPLVIENPLDDRLRERLLESVHPPLDKYDTFYRYNQPLKMSSLLKKIHRVSKSKNKNPIVDFKKTGDLYCIRSELGEGGYATVYLAESSTGGLRALKVEKPSNVWEYYILKQVENRLKGKSVLRSIINASSLHCFQDESYLVLNYASQGTILDLINLQREKSNGPVDELLCMFLTVELLKVVEAIHNVGIIHGDLKPDNCMVRFENGSMGSFDTRGLNGWNTKGIYLIDFGRSFDMTLLQPETKFKANWGTDQQDCYEMRQGEPWSFEADYYGLAGIIHAMLYGEFIETLKNPDGSVKLKNSFRRYWNQEIWSSVFNTLLNSRKFDAFPITPYLMNERQQIESYLQINANNKLRNIILDWEADLVRFRK